MRNGRYHQIFVGTFWYIGNFDVDVSLWTAGRGRLRILKILPPTDDKGVGSGWGRNDTLSAGFLGPQIFAGQ